MGEYRAFPIMRRRNFLQSRLEVPLFIRTLGLPAGARMLEVGCGPGVALPVFDRLLTPEVLIGIDIDDRLLGDADDRLRATGFSARLVRGDVRELPFADGRFDIVVDFGTCYHVGDPPRALGEIARVLVEGGIFATESKASQVLAHPVRTYGRRLQVGARAGLRPRSHALLWKSFRRVDGEGFR